jgi:hypothetical protein
MSTVCYSRWVFTVRVRRLSWRVTIISLRHFIILKTKVTHLHPFLPACFCPLHFSSTRSTISSSSVDVLIVLCVLHALLPPLNFHPSHQLSHRRQVLNHLPSPLFSCPHHIQCHHLCVSRINGNQPIVLKCTVVPTVLFIHMYKHVN